MAPVAMPDKYIVEMLMDRIAACQVYEGEHFTWESPLEYYRKGKNPAPLHPYTKEMLELLLHMLAEKGREETFLYIQKEILKKKKK